MADLTVVNPTNLAGNAPVSATVASGGDRFLTTKGRKYLMRFNNADAGVRNVIFDDPTSQNPGAATAFNPDVTLALTNGSPPTNQEVVLIDADRFGDANGWVNMTYSPAPTAVTVEIYGPL